MKSPARPSERMFRDPPKHGIQKRNMPDELQLQRGSDQKRSGFQQTTWGIHIMNMCIDRWMDEWMDG